MASSALLALALYLLATSAAAANAASRPTVTLSAGRVAGTSTGSVTKFLGVPFAAPPVRFDPPQAAPAWQGTYDASRLKSSCVQEFKYPEDVRNRSISFFNNPGPPAGESEDCLYINIFTPAGATAGTKPVMFWIYGGNMISGTGTLPQYNGTSFAENQDVVVVTFNYRTGVFGYPGSPEKPQSEQNLGLLDQRLALDWVQQNIWAFGGDPARVTLFGQSAGAFSVDMLVTNPPQMPPPFIGAILESGQYTVNTVNNPDILKSAMSWAQLVQAVGCGLPATALPCMRMKPAIQLKSLAEHNKLTWSPIYDGKTASSLARINRRQSTPTSPRIARVPILIGSSANEGTTFVYDLPPGVRGALSSLLNSTGANSSIIAGLTSRILAAYPNNPSPGPVNQQLTNIYTDLIFDCTVKLVSEETANAGIPSWRYYYNASFPNTDLYLGSAPYHSSEITEVFGTYPRSGATPFQIRLSRDIQKAWADFARNPAGGPGWPSIPKIAVIGAGVRPGGENNGTGKSTITVQDPTSTDDKCFLYQALYDAVSLPV